MGFLHQKVTDVCLPIGQKSGLITHIHPKQDILLLKLGPLLLQTSDRLQLDAVVDRLPRFEVALRRGEQV